MAGPREWLRQRIARLLKPGVAPAVHRLDALADRLAALERAQADRADRLESHLSRVTGELITREKYTGELAYWRWLIATDAGRASLEMPFEELFGRWQRDRLRELIPILGLDGDEGLDDWCRRRSAVEIGGGPFPALAAAQWQRAVVVDPLARDYARERLLARAARHVIYVEAPGERVPLGEGCADLVVMENALDHVSDPPAVLREAWRLLKPRGLLWLLVDLTEYRDYIHPHALSAARVRTLLAEAGFQTVSERVSDHKSHPRAYGEYRGLLRRGTAEQGHRTTKGAAPDAGPS